MRSLAILALVALGLVPGGATGSTSVLYDTDSAVREVVRAGLTAEQGALRQAPAGRDPLPAGRRVSKVSDEELIGASAEAIAATLKRHVRACRIRGNDYGCASHLAFVDELGAAFNDRRGSSNATNLAAAMRQLEEPSPYGGTWASRVHFYMAPNFTSAIAKGRGPDFNRGRDGKPHFATWRRLMPALARSGGVWLEMYHAVGGLSPFTAGEWRSGPRKVDVLLRRAGGGTGQLHFLMTRAGSAPAGARGCGGPMACQWTLAASGSVNRAIMMNGVGGYRLGDQAGAWAREHRSRI